MSQPARLPATGRTCAFGGQDLTGLSSIFPKWATKSEEVKLQGEAFVQRVVLNNDWTAEAEVEFLTLSRELLPALSIGSISTQLEQWSLKLDVKVGEGVGQQDKWVQKVPTSLDVSVGATRWQASDSKGLFFAALKAQIDAGIAQPVVTVTTPFGSFSAVFGNADPGESNDLLNEKTEVKIASGSFTPGALCPFVFTRIAAYKAALDAGLAPTAEDLVIAEGNGLAYLTAAELSCPAGRATGKLTWTGATEFLPASS